MCFGLIFFLLAKYLFGVEDILGFLAVVAGAGACLAVVIAAIWVLCRAVSDDDWYFIGTFFAVIGTSVAAIPIGLFTKVWPFRDADGMFLFLILSGWVFIVIQGSALRSSRRQEEKEREARRIEEYAHWERFEDVALAADNFHRMRGFSPETPEGKQLIEALSKLHGE